MTLHRFRGIMTLFTLHLFTDVIGYFISLVSLSILSSVNVKVPIDYFVFLRYSLNWLDTMLQKEKTTVQSLNKLNS